MGRKENNIDNLDLNLDTDFNLDLDLDENKDLVFPEGNEYFKNEAASFIWRTTRERSMS